MDLERFRSLAGVKDGGQQQKEEKAAMSVSQLNEYVRSLLAESPVLADVTVRGEISNFTFHRASGHLYFSLKDADGVLSAVMFRSSAGRLRFQPENGMKVLARGSVSVYVRDGKYQLYVTMMEPDGIGSLYLAFEQLKKKLEQEGLFDEKRKRPLPRFPRRIGVITSPTGAAVRDILQILGRRFPQAKVVLYPALVQGAEAPASLLAGVHYFHTHKAAAVLIIGRGGGSFEDLYAFNDERLARAIAASTVPVVSAVGHETDFTICDFVADRRAPTPSAAAEIAVPDVNEILRSLVATQSGLQATMQKRIAQETRILNQIAQSRVFSRPDQMLDHFRIRLDEREADLSRAVEQTILQKRQTTASLVGKLQALNPLSVLARGYATVSKDGKSITSVKQINDNDTLDIRMADGSVRATVSQRKDIAQ